MQNAKNIRFIPALIALSFLFLFMEGCSPTRKLKEGDYLLRNIHIKTDNNIFSKEDFKTHIRQKPNKKLLGTIRLNLQLYNLINQERNMRLYEKRKAKRARTNLRIAEKNQKNRKKGKRLIKLKNENPSCLSKWMLNIGEAPVVFDSILARRSLKQMKLMLNNNGYFNARVKDSVYLNSQKKFADLTYLIETGKPFLIDSIIFLIEDSSLDSLFKEKAHETMIKKGDIFTVSRLDQERTRITDHFKENGYYAFVKNFITYDADSSTHNHRIILELNIRKNAIRIPGFLDSLKYVDHLAYRISDVYFNGTYGLKTDEGEKNDTVLYKNLYLISRGPQKFRPRVVESAIFLKKGDLYNKRNTVNTYQRISDFHAFKFINIQFRSSKKDSSLLDCEIQLSPMSRQSFSIQGQTTNTQGNIGVSGNIIYQNRNLFHGLELFEFKINGGAEVQRILNGSTENNSLNEFIPFNTLMFGPEASIRFPKLIWPFDKVKSNDPQTHISSSFNYQERPDYKRSIYNLSFGYSWKPGRQSTISIDPAEINFVNVELGKSFSDLLNASNNLFLKSSFTSQLISASKISFIYSNQLAGERRNFLYAEFNLENSGLIPGISRRFFKNPEIENDKYLILGTPYAQYLRLDMDLRYYHFINSVSSLAHRLMLGFGNPYNNSNVMPFVRSFFSGGANDLRAWQARTLGPGSFNDPLGNRFDRIGDIKFQINTEYRLKIYKIFETAFFADAGNVWLKNADPSFPNGEFSLKRFYKEIAIGAGTGIRLNFDYFIIRLDAAHPIYDPSFKEGYRWSFNRLNLKSVNFNLGIAYPF